MKEKAKKNMNKQNVFEVDERESDPTQMVHTKFQYAC